MFVSRGLIAIGLAGLALSFTGALHPVGDSFAVFRTAFCLILILLAPVMSCLRLWRIAPFVLGLAGLSSVIWYKLPPAVTSAENGIVIYQKNVLYRNTDLAALAADILASDADFVTLQEMSVANDPLLARLKSAYPHQFLCRLDDRGGTAVLSRIKPKGHGPCSEDYGMALITVDLGAMGVMNVASVHLAWPFPGQQPGQVVDLLNSLGALDHPIIIGGDFNMVPWSHMISSVAQVSGTNRVGPARTTFLIGAIPVSIDHVFAPGGGVSQRRPLLGADHFGLLATVYPEE